MVLGLGFTGFGFRGSGFRAEDCLRTEKSRVLGFGKPPALPPQLFQTKAPEIPESPTRPKPYEALQCPAVPYNALQGTPSSSVIAFV